MGFSENTLHIFLILAVIVRLMATMMIAMACWEPYAKSFFKMFPEKWRKSEHFQMLAMIPFMFWGFGYLFFVIFLSGLDDRMMFSTGDLMGVVNRTPEDFIRILTLEL